MSEAITRQEAYLNAIAMGETTALKPITRQEMFLAKLAGQDVTLPAPITRKEMFLEAAIKGGGSGGGTGWDGIIKMQSADIGRWSFQSVPVTDLCIDACYKVEESALFTNSTLKTATIYGAGRSTENSTTYGKFCFAGCKNLEYFKCNDVHTYGEHMFDGCVKLKSFEGARNKPTNAYLFVKEYMFSGCTSLESVSGLFSSINDNAFENCTSLKAVEMSETRYIGEMAFKGCTSLTELDMSVVEMILGCAFEGCTSLAFADLPKVASIGEGAFYNCLNLSTLILRNTEEVCQLNVTAVLGTKIATVEGMPTGEGFIYVPSALFDGYVTLLAQQIFMLTNDEATAEYVARACLRKIEDYPEICG